MPRASNSPHLVAPHSLRILQHRKVVFELAVVQKHNDDDKTSRHRHAEGERAGLGGVLGSVGYVGPGDTTDVVVVVSVGKNTAEDGAKARDCCSDGDVARGKMQGDGARGRNFAGGSGGGGVRRVGRRGADWRNCVVVDKGRQKSGAGV